MDKECERIFNEWLEENKPSKEMRKIIIKFKPLFFSFLVTFFKQNNKKDKMKSILVYNEYSDTIRQQPENYCIAVRRNRKWFLDFDLAADKEFVVRVALELFEFDSAYGTGLHLLSKITPNEEFKIQLEKSNKKLEVIQEILSYDDRDEDEKIREIEELLNDN